MPSSALPRERAPQRRARADDDVRPHEKHEAPRISAGLR